MNLRVSLLLALFTVTAFSFSVFDDDDLVEFHTVPEIRALKWNVTYHDREAVAPGYWFVSPYFINEGERSTNRWSPCQIGPYIYDQDGELVWTGSCRYENRNIQDFKVVQIGDKPHLALRKSVDPDQPGSESYCIVLDDRYKDVFNTPMSPGDTDTHDFQVTGPHTALTMVHNNKELNVPTSENPERLVNMGVGGFIEFDLETGERLSQWRSEEHVAPEESYIFDPTVEQPSTDYFHANSVDKTNNGDYLLSARHTDAIYLISGTDGSIIWRLGGRKSDFEMDFTFNRQHDARVFSMNETQMIISFLNNGADESHVFDPVSSGMYVRLDLVEMKATLLHRYLRPDGKSTVKRGNMQSLPNSNVLMGWSKSAYISEFSHDGKLLMEASFASDRLDSYRAFKFPWVSRRPRDPPILVASIFGGTGHNLSTVLHVSWNGATEVRLWRFYARASDRSSKIQIGTTVKVGFETSFMVPGYMNWVSVDAIDSNGEVLGTSEEVVTSLPEDWTQTQTELMPDDPEALWGAPAAETQTPSAFLWVLVVLFSFGLGMGVTSLALPSRLGWLGQYLRSQCPWPRALYSKVQLETDEEAAHLTK